MEYQMITANVVKDSISSEGIRLISIETTAPKFLDAEIEKHRMISSNSSSSRAIPFARLAERDPFIPPDVRLNERGMQGYNKMPMKEYDKWVKEADKLYSNIVNTAARWESTYNIHKQHLNRYLEPFTIQYKIMTGTKEEWEYFLSLRDSPDADPNVQVLAKYVKTAICASEPARLRGGEWHLPYLDSILEKDAIVSAARCARVSYKTHDGEEPTREADEKLSNFLIKAKHLTPFEHQARPMWKADDPALTHTTKDGNIYSANLRGWAQYRKLI